MSKKSIVVLPKTGDCGMGRYDVAFSCTTIILYCSGQFDHGSGDAQSLGRICFLGGVPHRNLSP